LVLVLVPFNAKTLSSTATGILGVIVGVGLESLLEEAYDVSVMTESIIREFTSLDSTGSAPASYFSLPAGTSRLAMNTNADFEWMEINGDVGVVSVGKMEWDRSGSVTRLIFEGRSIVGGFLEGSMWSVSYNIYGRKGKSCSTTCVFGYVSSVVVQKIFNHTLVWENGSWFFPRTFVVSLLICASYSSSG
jgi:hypothetical protein